MPPRKKPEVEQKTDIKDEILSLAKAGRFKILITQSLVGAILDEKITIERDFISVVLFSFTTARDVLQYAVDTGHFWVRDSRGLHISFRTFQLHNEAICKECGGQCCAYQPETGDYGVEPVYDRKRLKDKEYLKELKKKGIKTTMCTYNDPKTGCVIPRENRPKICTQHVCDKLVGNIQPSFPDKIITEDGLRRLDTRMFRLE